VGRSRTSDPLSEPPKRISGNGIMDTMRDIADPGASSPRTVGEEPKPRALFSWEGPATEQVAAVLDLHAPTVRVIDDLLGIRQDDYDLLVTNRLCNMLVTPGARFKGVEPHLFVVSVAPPDENASTAGAADLCGQRLDFCGRSSAAGALP
jgi:hypothetical protein